MQVEAASSEAAVPSSASSAGGGSSVIGPAVKPDGISRQASLRSSSEADTPLRRTSSGRSHAGSTASSGRQRRTSSTASAPSPPPPPAAAAEVAPAHASADGKAAVEAGKPQSGLSAIRGALEGLISDAGAALDSSLEHKGTPRKAGSQNSSKPPPKASSNSSRPHANGMFEGFGFGGDGGTGLGGLFPGLDFGLGSGTPAPATPASQERLPLGNAMALAPPDPPAHGAAAAALDGFGGGEERGSGRAAEPPVAFALDGHSLSGSASALDGWDGVDEHLLSSLAAAEGATADAGTPGAAPGAAAGAQQSARSGAAVSGSQASGGGRSHRSGDAALVASVAAAVAQTLAGPEDGFVEVGGNQQQGLQHPLQAVTDRPPPLGPPASRQLLGSSAFAEGIITADSTWAEVAGPPTCCYCPSYQLASES